MPWERIFCIIWNYNQVSPPPLYTVDYTIKSKTTGQESTVSAIDYMEKEVWKNQDMEISATGDQYLFKEGTEPSIHDFVLETRDGEDITDYILSQELVFLWVAYDIDGTNEDALVQVKEIAQGCKSDSIPIYMLSASDYEITNRLKQTHHLDIEVLTCDETTLKTIIRSNPGLVILKKGVVVAKYPFRKVSDMASVMKNLD